jgi:ketosteroid isomerase-like protein
MKKLVITSFFALFIIAVNAQGKAGQSVAAAVESLKKAMIDGDSLSLSGITDNDLFYGHSGGKIEDKATFISNIVSGKSDFVTIDLADQTITVKGNTAIVHHILSATTNDSGKPGTVKLAILLVWVKDGRGWKLLARQAVKV